MYMYLIVQNRVGPTMSMAVASAAVTVAVLVQRKTHAERQLNFYNIAHNQYLRNFLIPKNDDRKTTFT